MCVLAFSDRNHNGARDPGEGLLGGMQVSLGSSATQAPLATYTTTGITPNEPYCFLGLTPGNYTLAFTGPNLVSTTPANLMLAAPAGQTVRVEHGAVSLADGGPVEAGTTGGANTMQRLAIATIGAAIVISSMTLLGGLFYMLFLR